MTYCRQRKGARQSHEYIPVEMWIEILSKLPVKTLFVSQCVCKLWRELFFTVENKIDTNRLSVPLCGFFLLSFTIGEDGPSKIDRCYSYLSFETGEILKLEPDSADSDLIHPSGFERGLLVDVSFNFSILQKLPLADSKSQFICFVMHKGLIYATREDGTSEMHNPATNEIHFVPKSAIVEKYGFKKHAANERRGFLIQFPSYLKPRCHFIVVRLSVALRIIEVYDSETRKWVKYRLKVDNKFLRLVSWRYSDYVGFFERGVLSLYVLTSRDRGIAIKFKGPFNPEMKQYTFPLPEVVLEGGASNRRIWESKRTLYLSYYNATGLWIWKAGCTQVDAWAWISILEISPARQLCKPLIHDRLSREIVNAGVRVMPLAFHPDVAIVYLLVKSTLFVYNLDKDTLEPLGDIVDDDLDEDKELHVVNAFKPCLRLTGFGESWLIRRSTISSLAPISWLVLVFLSIFVCAFYLLLVLLLFLSFPFPLIYNSNVLVTLLFA